MPYVFDTTLFSNHNIGRKSDQSAHGPPEGVVILLLTLNFLAITFFDLDTIIPEFSENVFIMCDGGALYRSAKCG